MRTLISSFLLAAVVLAGAPLGFGQVKKEDNHFKCFIDGTVIVLPLEDTFIKRCVLAGGIAVLPDGTVIGLPG